MKQIILTKALLLLAVVFLASCGNNSGQRKIQLSDTSLENSSDAQLSTTIYLEEQRRRSLAVLFFENETGDQNLEWLRQGLTEMFVRALSQSHSLSVMGTDRLYEIAERIESDPGAEGMDLDMAAVFAKEANVETILTGNITRVGDSLQINVSLHEASEGMVLSNESVEGPGMENLFAMVDQLTQKLKNELQIDPEDKSGHKGLADLSTESIDAWRHYTAGMDYIHRLMNEEALAEFEKAVEIDSTFVSAYRMLAMAHFGTNNAPRALQMFKKASSLREKATLKERYQIDLFEAVLNNDEKTMRQVYDQMQKDFPDDIDGAYALAGSYFTSNRYEEALALYEKVIQIDPNHAISLNQIAYGRAFLGDFDRSVEVMKKYIEMVPDQANPYDSMGEILWMQGDFKGAEKYYKKALERNSTFWGSWEHLGDIYIDMGKYDKAHQVYLDYLDIVPDGANKAFIYYRMGIIDLRQGKPIEALKHFELAYQELDYFGGAVIRTAEVYEKQNNEEKLQNYIKDRYDEILSKVDYNDQTMVHINTLFNLSIRFDINAQKTMEVLHHFIEGDIRSAVKLRGLFMQILLELQLDGQNNSNIRENVWNREESDLLVQFLGFTNNIGYAGFFRHFANLNRHFAESPDSGILFYNYLISQMVEQEITTYEMGFRGLLADLFERAGKRQYAEAEWQRIGMAEESLWRVIGPFDNKNGFHKSFKPEKEQKWEKTYKNKHLNQKLTWITHNDSVADGYINLRPDLTQSDWAVAYAALDVVVNEACQAWIRLGSTDPVKVWVNGDEVWRFNRYRNALLDDDKVAVTLTAGRNRLLVKICNRMDNMGFYFRITDTHGTALKNIRFVAPDAPANESLVTFNDQ